LIALILIGEQMDYFRSKNLGFDKENVVMLSIPDNKQKQVFKNELSKMPQVMGVSFSTSPPSGDERTHWGTIMSTKSLQDPDRKHVMLLIADENYSRLYGFKLKAGRFIQASDTTAHSRSLPEGQRYPKVIVNEKLVEELKFGSNEAALGKRFHIGMNGWQAEVSGVVENFNVGSLRDDIKPALIVQEDQFYDKANIKLKAGTDIPAAIESMKRSWKSAFPKGVFEFNFLDQQLDAMYKTESRLYDLFKIFSALAMLISCLGLWGLVTFAAEQRVKEIGIRKVLGASVANIVTLISKDFIILVGISILIASPLAYWGMSKWLQEFAFRIPISWIVFAVAGGAAVVIALLTVSVQAIKAAISNPADSLRTE
jgi:ABC-type antimicrobial peptide transport system permease subunit